MEGRVFEPTGSFYSSMAIRTYVRTCIAICYPKLVILLQVHPAIGYICFYYYALAKQAAASPKGGCYPFIVWFESVLLSDRRERERAFSELRHARTRLKGNIPITTLYPMVRTYVR